MQEYLFILLNKQKLRKIIFFYEFFDSRRRVEARFSVVYIETEIFILIANS